MIGLAADAAALLARDARLAGELGAGGRAPWQVFAGAVLASGTWRAALLSSLAPNGVAYHVAVWEPCR